MKCVVLVACLLSCLAGARAKEPAQVLTGFLDPAQFILGAPEPVQVPPETEFDGNNIVDFILESLRQEIVATGQEQFKMPDLSERFVTKVTFFKVVSQFDAWNGVFRNVASLRRTGDVVVSHVNAHTYSLQCALGFDEVNVEYENYRLHVKNTGSVSGRISGSVGENSVVLKVEIDTGDGQMCKATLKELRVEKMEDMRLRLTGLGILNGMAGRTATGALRKRKSMVIEKIESALTSNVEKGLLKVKCDL